MEVNNEGEPCGTRKFEEKEKEIASLTKETLQTLYPVYWSGLELTKNVINLLIHDVSNGPTDLGRKYSTALLLLINRSVQHIESLRLLVECGLYGDGFVVLRSLMSDLSMMQYIHHHPELLDLFLKEKQKDYQENKEFKKAFSENMIEKELVGKGARPFGSAFQLLSKASHASSFGSQLYGSRGKEKEKYHLNYGPKFQADKAIMLMDMVASSHRDIVNNILWHRYHSKEEIDTEDWNKVKTDLEKLECDVSIITEAVKKTVKAMWPIDG